MVFFFSFYSALAVAASFLPPDTANSPLSVSRNHIRTELSIEQRKRCLALIDLILSGYSSLASSLAFLPESGAAPIASQ
jgi:hypothetical protein